MAPTPAATRDGVVSGCATGLTASLSNALITWVMTRDRAARCAVVAVLLVGLAACGAGDEKDAPEGDAGSSGSSTAGGWGGGSAAASGNGRGGRGASGTGGSGGASPVCPKGLTEFGAADADLTLGSLNADLPSPSLDCLTVAASATTCIALSLEIGDNVRELLCTGLHIQATDGASVTCSTDEDEYLNLKTNQFGGTSLPATFTTGQTGPVFGGMLKIELADGVVDSREDGFTEARMAGWVNKWVDSNYCRNASFGVIAASWSESELGAVRVRGTFHTRSY